MTRLLELIYTVIEGSKQSDNSVVGDVFVVVVVVMLTKVHFHKL